MSATSGPAPSTTIQSQLTTAYARPIICNPLGPFSARDPCASGYGIVLTRAASNKYYRAGTYGPVYRLLGRHAQQSRPRASFSSSASSHTPLLSWLGTLPSLFVFEIIAVVAGPPPPLLCVCVCVCVCVCFKGPIEMQSTDGALIGHIVDHTVHTLALFAHLPRLLRATLFSLSLRLRLRLPTCWLSNKQWRATAAC